MTEFETRANNIATALAASHYRVAEFGHDQDPPEESVSRIYGMFITWLTACEEARHSESFSRSVIGNLPNVDDPSWDNYISPSPTSSLKERASAMWGIRIAFTHGDGEISQITNDVNRNYAIDSERHLRGVANMNGFLVLNNSIRHEAIRTIVQLRDLLP